MNAVICPETGKSQEYKHLMKGPRKIKWTREFANKIRRIFQGIRDIEGTKTCFFIHEREVPKVSKVTYNRILLGGPLQDM